MLSRHLDIMTGQGQAAGQLAYLRALRWCLTMAAKGARCWPN